MLIHRKMTSKRGR